MLAFHTPSGPGFRVKETAFIVVLGLVLSVGSTLPALVRSIGSLWPEWTVILTIYLAWRARPALAASGAFLMGVLADALRLAPEGLRPLTLVLSVVALSYSSKLLRFHGYIQLAFLCFALTFFINIIFIPIFLGIMGNLGQMEAIPVRYLAGRAVGALITGLIGPVVFYVLDSWLINPKAVK